MTTIDGEDVYKIKVNNDEKASYRFYNVKTGLLTRTESTTKAQGKEVTSTVDFGNYTTVDGIQFPYSMKLTAGPQVIPFVITSVEVNNSVTDADFE